MVSPKRPQPPFSSFGWSLSGALLIALSLPPLGVYPLAWVGLVPRSARGARRRPSLDYVRERYALLLTTSCCVGFWMLFNPDAATAALGGITLFLVPIPLVAAFAISNVVRERLGLAAGLVALSLNVLAAEFLTLKMGISVPWLVLGYTQADAVEFIQMADLGGVLLLSLWVLLLNYTAFLALPRTDKPGDRYGERERDRYGGDRDGGDRYGGSDPYDRRGGSEGGRYGDRYDDRPGHGGDDRYAGDR